MTVCWAWPKHHWWDFKYLYYINIIEICFSFKRSHFVRKWRHRRHASFCGAIDMRERTRRLKPLVTVGNPMTPSTLANAQRVRCWSINFDVRRLKPIRSTNPVNLVVAGNPITSTDQPPVIAGTCRLIERSCERTHQLGVLAKR